MSDKGVRFKANPNLRDGQCTVFRPGKFRTWVGPVTHIPKTRNGDVITLSTGDYLRAMQAYEQVKQEQIAKSEFTKQEETTDGTLPRLHGPSGDPGDG